MASDLHVICEELRQISLCPATLAAREKVKEALSSKWDGVQVAAAKALSRWGDPLSLHALRDFLASIAGNPGRRSAIRAVASVIYPHLQPSDLDWVIDLFIRRARPGTRSCIAGLFDAFAHNEVRSRLAARLDDAHDAKANLRNAIARAELLSKGEITATLRSKAAIASQSAKRKAQKAKPVVRGGRGATANYMA